MKRFILVFCLCVILPFLLLQPLSSNADNGTFSVQGTEYSKPRFLSPDIDFDYYSHYFLLVYGTPDNPSYQFYAVAKEDVSEDCLRFSPAFTSGETRFYSYLYHNEHSFTTSYDYVRKYSLDISTGLSSFEVLKNVVVGWVFDDYSTFDASLGSSSKYIIGSNCDIYDYSGNLLRSGDYDNLCSFFVDGLKGSSNKSHNPLPTETTTSCSSSGGGSNGNIDLGNIPDLLDSIFDKLGSVAEALNAITTAVSAKVISDRLDEIKTLLSNINGNLVVFEHLKNYLDKKFDNVSLEISEFKKSFLEFASVNGEIKKLGELFSSINISISNLKQGLENAVNSVKTDFNDFSDDVKSNVSSMRLILNDFTGKLDTLVSKSSDIFTDLHAVREHTYNIRQHAYDCKSRLFTIISKLDSILSSFDNHFSELISIIRSEYSDIRKTVDNLPESFGELFIYLFVPKEDHFSGLDNVSFRFEFVNQIIKIGDAVVNFAEFNEQPPVFNFDFSHNLFGDFSVKLDFGVIPYKYVAFVRNFIRGFILIVFVRRTRKRLPEVINGIGG